MSTAYIKKKLKDLKEALGAKDWTGVEKNANDVLESDGGNYNARVFLSLALFNLDRFDEAEASYKKAIENSPSQPLARQGLAAFYEKRQRWSDYSWSLQELMQMFEAAGDAPKYAETLQKLLAVRRSHGTTLEVIETLHLLLPSSPVYPLLSTLPSPDSTNPTATPYHSLQLLLVSPLPTLLELVSMTETLENTAVESEISKRRQRLGGTTLSAAETRRVVQGEFMVGSQLPALYRAVLDEPDAGNDDDLRRGVEKKLLTHRRTLLRALPSSWDREVDLRKAEKSEKKKMEEEERKGGVRQEVEELARGMVVVGVREVEAWNVVLDWGDRAGEKEGREWERFVERFEETGLAKIIEATRLRALPPPSEDEEDPPMVPSDEETAQIIEDGLAASPDSLLAHILSCDFFAETKDWQPLMEIAEAGLALLVRLQTEMGRGLPRSRRVLESHLAVALVHLNPPLHHLRALRLLDALLSSSPLPSLRLLKAKAFLLQYSEKWAAAKAAWDLVIATTPEEQTEWEKVEVMGERSWCVFNAGELEEAENGLREVVGKLMERMEEREKEEREREKERSRKGLSRPEGVEEGETAEEKEERAVGWWRLGRCLWEMGETDPDKNGEAFDAFISSVKASNTFAPAFTSLGTFYETVEPADFKRAFECYKKAFELDGSQEVAALFLAQEFSEEGEWTLVEKIARRVVQGSAGGAGSAALGGKAAKRLSWAWKAIGGAELNSQKYPQAIAAFQSALRGAPDDSHTWIRLGIAYRESGKFIAALKVFVKALSLDPDSWYAKFLIGDVQKEIGLLEPAIKVFREILEDRPDELGVRVVLAETALAKGQDEFNGNFLGRAEESLIVALEEASKIIDAGSATRVAWKVAGDALVGLGKIPLPASLDRSTPLALHLLEVIGKADVDTRIEGMDGVRVEALRQAVHNAANPAFFLALAVLASKMRVLLETQNEVSIGSAWLDLGLSLSAIRPHLAPLGLPSAEHDALLQAVRCIKYALHKEPVNASFWNALGVLAFDLSPRLTQHAFIKSIEYNSRTAVPWANLGVFYLVHGDEDLANEAFLKAQVLDPDYGAAWVGQARLATLAGHTREASVLLEHAFTLGATTPEADVGYAESAFKAFRAQSKAKATTSQTREEASAALSGPLFAISRYLSKHPTDVSALHLSALILERVGDLDSASAALEKAAEMLSEIYDAEESPEAEARYIVSQTNLGRVRLAKEDFEGALEAFEPPLALLPLPGEARDVEGALKKEEAILLYTECRLGSAMASFWNGDAGAAKDQLSDALEDLEAVEGGKKANLGTCLARIYWSEEDIDRSLGSMLDVPDIVSPKSPLFVKLVMEAMGTMTQERVTLEVVERLSRRDTAVKYDHDFTRLKALEKLLKGDQVGATSIVSRTLHATPWENHTRRALAWLLIELTPTPSASSNQNLSSVSRFVRTGVIAHDDAARFRARRHVGLTTARVAEGKVEEAERLMEKAVWVMPWADKGRELLVRVGRGVKEGMTVDE